MDRNTHCPNCFKKPAPAPKCQHCGFDAKNYSEATHLLPLFTPLDRGNYIIGRVISEAGGFSIVYGGFQQRLQRHVVIKEFFPHQSNNALASRLKNRKTVIARPRCKSTFSTWKKRFLQEAKTLSSLSHLNNPRIVQVFDVFEENDTAYLVMEYLEGCTLSEYLGGLHSTRNDLNKAGCSLSSNEVQSLLETTLEALDAMHGFHPKPIIHCDLTPHNLFLVNRNLKQLKVLDFGLAQFGEGTVTSTTLGVGNPPFASPEQMNKDFGPLTPATDFYTLGASLYTALFRVTPPTVAQRRDKQSLLSLNSIPNINPTLAKIISDCLEMDPNQRPQNVAEIRYQLKARTVLPPEDLKPVTPPELDLQTTAPPPPLALTSKTRHSPKGKLSPKSTDKPKALDSTPTPKRLHLTPFLNAIAICGLMAFVGLTHELKRKNFDQPADVAPAPSTQTPTPLPSSEIQTPTVTPTGEPASQKEQSSPIVSNSVAKLTLGPSTQKGQNDSTVKSSFDMQHSVHQTLDDLKRLAKKNDPQAQNRLAMLYLFGQGVIKNDQTAFKWFYKAAAQGHADAQNNLGLMYVQGRGKEQDDQKAVKLFRRAALQEHAEAQYNLGWMYAEGRGVPQNDQEAVKWYRRSADQQDASAQYRLGWMYSEGRGVPQNDQEAVKWYRRAVEQGLAEAQFNLGVMLDVGGHRVSQDVPEAVKLLRKAADQGLAEAQYFLGKMYLESDGIHQDTQEAIKLIRKAADQELAEAQYLLGKIYLEGFGVPNDDKEAVKWFDEAAAQGHTAAQNKLGEIYAKDRRNNQKAIDFFCRAAERGNANAQYNLANIFANGLLGVRQNNQEAIKWLIEAAKQGLASAQYALGTMYENGRGVPQDDQQAVVWYGKAAEQGDTDAKTALMRLEKQSQ